MAATIERTSLLLGSVREASVARFCATDARTGSGMRCPALVVGTPAVEPPGTFSRCPMRMVLEDRPFALRSAALVVPYRTARWLSVSPLRTRWVPPDDDAAAGALPPGSLSVSPA